MKNWSVINEASFDIPKGLNQKSRILFCLPSDHFKSLINYYVQCSCWNQQSFIKLQTPACFDYLQCISNIIYSAAFSVFSSCSKAGLVCPGAKKSSIRISQIKNVKPYTKSRLAGPEIFKGLNLTLIFQEFDFHKSRCKLKDQL